MTKNREEVSRKRGEGEQNVGTRAKTTTTGFRASSQSLPANTGQQYYSNLATTTSLRTLPTSPRTHQPCSMAIQSEPDVHTSRVAWVAVTNRFCNVVPNIHVASVWNLPHVQPFDAWNLKASIRHPKNVPTPITSTHSVDK